MSHKAGFVNIIGKPNCGKSTLINKLIDEKLCITSHKQQTTRNRIMGILNGDNYQIVLSDTPGIIEPKYELHKCMMKYVNHCIQDADIIIFIADINYTCHSLELIEKVMKNNKKIFLVLNKMDTCDDKTTNNKINNWQSILESIDIIPISALNGKNVDLLKTKIIQSLPPHPPYFDKSLFTTQSTRFMVSEIIREKIMLNYHQELPYCCQVEIYLFKEYDHNIDIQALIFVERDTQKYIIIGKRGTKLKNLIFQSSQDIKKALNKDINLNIHIKVNKNWRNDKLKLKKYKYI